MLRQSLRINQASVYGRFTIRLKNHGNLYLTSITKTKHGYGHTVHQLRLNSIRTGSFQITADPRGNLREPRQNKQASVYRRHTSCLKICQLFLLIPL